MIQAKYALLHTTGELRTKRLYKIIPGGPQIYSRHDLIKKHYPIAAEEEKTKEAYYMVYSLEEVMEPELKDRMWDVSRLTSYQGGRNSAMSFVVTLSELVKVDF